MKTTYHPIFTLLVTALAVLSLFASPDPASAGTVSRDDAIASVIANHISGTPEVNNVAAFMPQTTYGFGQTITDPYGVVLHASGPLEEFWVAFLDDDIVAEWSHEGRVVLVNANDANDTQEFDTTGWWIQFDGIDYNRDPNSLSVQADSFYGNEVPAGPGAEDSMAWLGKAPEVPPTLYPTALKKCALIVKASDENRRDGDAAAYAAVLAAEGVPNGNITTLDNPDQAALEAAIAAIDDDCDKLYVMWTGHGTPNHVNLGNGNTNYPASTLAAKIKARNPKEVCLVFGTCFSGSILDEFCDAGLVGTGWASSEADKKSRYHRSKVGGSWVDDYGYFPKFLKECKEEAGNNTCPEILQCIKDKFQNLTDAEIQEGAVYDWFAKIRAQCPQKGDWDQGNSTPADAHDNAADWTLTDGTTVTGTTAGATNDDGDVGNDVFYIMNKTGGPWKITITLNSEADTDFELRVFEKNADGTVGKKIGDNSNWGQQKPVVLTLECVPAGSYYVVVDEFGFKRHIGQFSLTVDCEPWSAPADESFADPSDDNMDGIYSLIEPIDIQGFGYEPHASYPIYVWPDDGQPLFPGMIFPPSIPEAAGFIQTNEFGDLWTTDLLDQFLDEEQEVGNPPPLFMPIIMHNILPAFDGQPFICAIDRNGNGQFDFEEQSSIVQFQLSFDATSTTPSVAGAIQTRNYPNPFNPQTTIEYSLERTQHVDVAVYDVSGRRVRVLERSVERAPGTYTVQWNGEDDSGRRVASGAYWYRVTTATLEATRQITLVK